MSIAATESVVSPLSWKVGGMDCAGCAAKIRGAVERLPGVSDVRLSVMTETLTMSLDENQTSRAAIEKQVSGLGYSMGDVGFVYVPPQCKAGTCGLHVALHGCEQSVDKVGEAFVRDAGYNRWADAASMVVLYPQVSASLVPLNPKGCWDWWGYTGADYDLRAGAQLQFLARMLAALGVET